MNGLAIVQQALPGTVAALMRKTGYGKSLVAKSLRVLRVKEQAHIVGWDRPDGRLAAVYGAGPGQDVPQSEAKSLSDYHQCGQSCMAVSARVVPTALRAQQRAFPLAGVWA